LDALKPYSVKLEQKATEFWKIFSAYQGISPWPGHIISLNEHISVNYFILRRKMPEKHRLAAEMPQQSPPVSNDTCCRGLASPRPAHTTRGAGTREKRRHGMDRRWRVVGNPPQTKLKKLGA